MAPQRGARALRGAAAEGHEQFDNWYSPSAVAVQAIVLRPYSCTAVGSSDSLDQPVRVFAKLALAEGFWLSSQGALALDRALLL